jgi:hypothetical protein
MRTIYIDTEFKCHIHNDGTMLAVETDAFDGCCDSFVEGFRFVPEGASWTRTDGEVFEGEMASAWVPFENLEIAQREYEKMTASLEDAYREGVNSL